MTPILIGVGLYLPQYKSDRGLFAGPKLQAIVVLIAGVCISR